MKGKLNNIISKYEGEKARLKLNKEPGPAAQARIDVINEILSALYDLKGVPQPVNY